jgi:hypothetical protein
MPWLMVEAVNHIWLLLTSILEIYCVLAPFNDVSVYIMSEPLHLQHYYTNKPGSILARILGSLAKLKWCHDVMVEADCTPPLIAFHIHIGCIDIVMAPFHDVRGHMSALLLRYTSKARSDFWQFWVTVEWKWCHGSWPWCHGWGCKPHLVAF